MDMNQLVRKINECLDLCETQIETSCGEILEGISLEDIAEMRKAVQKHFLQETDV